MWLERSEWLVSREWSENTDTDHHFLHGDDNAWILVGMDCHAVILSNPS